MPIELGAKPFYLNEKQISWVRDTLVSMTEEEKIHQLFCLVLYRDDEAYCRYLAEQIKPGGFMCRSMPLEQCVSAIERMQANSPIPLLVAANLENGGNGIVKEGANFAKPLQIAATGDAEHARRLGEVCGTEGCAVGANWAFAPIVDIDYNWRNPITNVRTYGSDPDTVAHMSTAYINELQSHGVAACAKHFPGDGCDERDQHVSLSVNHLSCEEWDNSYGKVWRACIESGVKTVMVGHILQPAYTRRFSPDVVDSDILPASLSRELVTGLLREQLGFNGLIITDSTAMAGLATHLPREQLVPLTVAAGCDMFLFTKNLEEDIAFMEQGYRNGVISEERLNDAVTRILALKASLGLPERQVNGTLSKTLAHAQDVLGQPHFLEWSREVAARSVTLVKEEKGIFPITPKRFPRVLFYPLDHVGNVAEENTPNGNFKAALEKAGFQVTVFMPKRVTEGGMDAVKDLTEQYDLLIYSACIKGGYQPTLRIQWSIPQGANIPTLCHTIPTVFVSLANPYHLADVPHVRTFINCYNGTPAVIDALIDRLTGKAPFTGISPVDAFCGKWDTHISFGPVCEKLKNGEKNTNVYL